MSYPNTQPPTGPQQGFGSAPAQPGYAAGPPAQYAAGYGAPAGYGAQPGYPYPAPSQSPYRANPLAGILLLLGGIAGILVGVLPWAGTNDPGVVLAFDVLSISGISAEATGLAISLLAATGGGLLAVVAAVLMFRRGRHGLTATIGLIGTLLMAAASITVLLLSDGHVLDGSGAVPWILTFCPVPALLGVIAGYTLGRPRVG